MQQLFYMKDKEERTFLLLYSCTQQAHFQEHYETKKIADRVVFKYDSLGLNFEVIAESNLS